MTTKHISQLKRLSIGIALGTAICTLGFAQTAPPETTPPQADRTKSDAPAKPWTPKLLSDGQPDVQGVWTAVYYGMGCLTNPTNGDVNCMPPPGPRPAPGTANAGGPPPLDASGRVLGQRGHGNPPSIVNVHLAQGERAGQGNGGQRAAGTEGPARAPRAARNAPSRIVDTANYDIPYTSEALAHQQDLFAHYYAPTRYGDIDPQQRCWPLGAVRQFTWQGVQIEQFPGYVLFIYEGGQVYRIVYLDGRPHIGSDLKLWMGDSRGHWEGTTLIVDTTNNNAKGRLSRAGDFSSDKVHHIERFKFTDADHFRYEATFDDPSVYTQKWTFALDERRAFFGRDGGGGGRDGIPTAESQAKYENWEEACHEGLIPGGNDVPDLPSVP